MRRPDEYRVATGFFVARSIDKQLTIGRRSDRVRKAFPTGSSLLVRPGCLSLVPYTLKDTERKRAA